MYMGADYASEGWRSVVWWPEGRRGGSCCTAESGRTDVQHLGTGAGVEKPNLTPRLQVGVSVQGGDKNRRVRAAVCREGTLRSLVQGLESPDSALGLPVVARLPPKGRSQEGGSRRRQSKGLPAHGGHTTGCVSSCCCHHADGAGLPCSLADPRLSGRTTTSCSFLGKVLSVGSSLLSQGLLGFLHCPLAPLALESLTTREARPGPLTPTKVKVGRGGSDPKAREAQLPAQCCRVSAPSL